jgi:hypothetical protein
MTAPRKALGRFWAWLATRPAIAAIIALNVFDRVGFGLFTNVVVSFLVYCYVRDGEKRTQTYVNVANVQVTDFDDLLRRANKVDGR